MFARYVLSYVVKLGTYYFEDCSRKDANTLCQSTELQSKQISKALQNLSLVEEVPLIKVNPDLKRSLPDDLFESALLESNNSVC